MLFYLDLLGCAIFAISAILAALKKELDVLGVFVVALVSAIGGGTLRDLMLGVEVFWLRQPVYIYVILATSLLSFFIKNYKNSLIKLLLFADGFGLALFTVLGLQKALSLGLPAIIGVIMGILTGVAGGIIRDIMFNDTPVVLRREIYVTASILSSVIYLILDSKLPSSVVIISSVLGGFSLRSYAIIKKTHLPRFF